MNPGPRFRCSEALLVLVGDTGIEPVTSSVSGINTVLSTPPLSTKTVHRHPLTSAHIRGRCHATSQSPRHPHISGRPRTFHTGRFPAARHRHGSGPSVRRGQNPHTAAHGGLRVAFLPGEWT